MKDMRSMTPIVKKKNRKKKKGSMCNQKEWGYEYPINGAMNTQFLSLVDQLRLMKKKGEIAEFSLPKEREKH